MPDPNKLQGKISREILFDLYHTKQTPMSEIAALFGVNTETIRYHMKRMDIPRRPAGGQKGQLNAAWRGGKTIDKHGYVLALAPDHPKARVTGYVLEHRLVMEQKLGRPLEDHEVVHHIDGNKQNNHPDNLEVYASNADHLREELTGRVPMWTPEGRKAIAEGQKKQRGKPWSYERREKAHQRAKERWEANNFRQKEREWTQEERDHMRQVAKYRKRLNGKFAS